MCARWPEPGVHLIERPPRRLDRKGSDHPLRQPVEIGSRAQRLPAVGLGVVMAGKEEDDIQVRRGRQRAATQPPPPQSDERSEDRTVGNEGVSTGKNWWLAYP